jgi:glucosyl-dolichyl phosphate glucuronosyltransferase
MTTPDLSVVLCTSNRAALLEGALRALIEQHEPPPHEIIVVDNASTDKTRMVIDAAAARCDRVRYLHETRQGLSHARNLAVREARGSMVAFIDDDVRVGAGWMRAAAGVLARYPDAACAGGPVVPLWPAAVPAWLTTRHWAPLGIQDYGGEAMRVDATRPVCLIGANLAFRRAALDAIGGFNPAVQRVGEAGGSTEDHELHLRLWAAGMHGIYDPALRVAAVVTPDRLRKRHHRSWHFRHGRHIARMKLAEMERSRASIVGVPAHLLRQAVDDARAWIRHLAAGDAVTAFERETRLWFVAGFVRERWA